jgi:putative DNA primase/helicase
MPNDLLTETVAPAAVAGAIALGPADDVGRIDKEAVRANFDCATYLLTVHGAAHLGGDRYTCPWRDNEHEANPAFAVSPTKWYDHHDSEGGDCFKLIMKLRDCDFPAALAEAEAFIREHPAPRPMAGSDSAWTPPPAAKTAKAMELWAECIPDTGCIADYLQSRGLSGGVPDDIRFHPSLPYLDGTEDDGAQSVRRFPAMVAKVRRSDGTDAGVHRTYLALDRPGKADVQTPKKMLGPTKGAAVHLGRFDSAEGILAITEGIETGIAVQEATDLPVWAALSVAGMKNLEMPSYDHLTLYIFADNDAGGSGQDAARALTERYAEKGRVTVHILIPPTPDTDWLDVHNTDGAEALRCAVAEAVECTPAPEPGANSSTGSGSSPVPQQPGADQDAPVPRGRPRRRGQAVAACPDPGCGNQAASTGPAEQGAAPVPAASPVPASDELPELLLAEKNSPEHVSISACAGQLGRLMAPAGRYFVRSGVPVSIAQQDGHPVLLDITKQRLPSESEHVACVRRPVRTKDGIVHLPTIMGVQQAEVILGAPDFIAALPEIRVLAEAPVLIQHANGDLVTVRGYDAESGIKVTGGAVEDVPLPDAVGLLYSIIEDFDFATPGDLSRALAALITPALVQGGLLQGRAPIDVLEADDTQAGKGYFIKIRAAIYCSTPATMACQHGGVGSLDETFATALLNGERFIAFDNLRGKVNSECLESALTEDRYMARVPRRQAVTIDVRRVIMSLTSNRAEMTRDLANRSSPVRIRKQPDGYRFHQYPDGDLLTHIRINQGRYLGAAFAVARHWHTQGCPRTDETGHSFCAWAQPLDWIVQNVFHAAPLCDGLPGARTLLSDDNLTWLRSACLVLVRQGNTDRWLTTSDIAEALGSAGEPLPGLPIAGDVSNPENRTAVHTSMGRRIGQAFTLHGQVDGDSTVIDLGAMSLERRVEHDNDKGREKYIYRLTLRAGGGAGAAPSRRELCLPRPPRDATSASATVAGQTTHGPEPETITAQTTGFGRELDLPL